jgi:hypothetical protein
MKKYESGLAGDENKSASEKIHHYLERHVLGT